MHSSVVCQLEHSPASIAAAASAPACFDVVASRHSCIWVVARSADRSVQVVHVRLPNSSSRWATNGSRHQGEPVASVELVLPEPVALAELAVFDLDSSAPDDTAGAALLMLVAHSCRVWVVELDMSATDGCPPRDTLAQHGSNRDVSAAAERLEAGCWHKHEQGPAVQQVELRGSAGVLVPVYQRRCAARHQLAAAVAWEHLCHAWQPQQQQRQPPAEPDGVEPKRRRTDQLPIPSASAGSCSSCERTSGTISVVPVCLAVLASRLRQLSSTGSAGQLGRQPAPELFTSVASWVCRNPRLYSVADVAPAGAAAGVPEDAIAAAYVALPRNSSAPELTCRSRCQLSARFAGAPAGSWSRQQAGSSEVGPRRSSAGTAAVAVADAALQTPGQHRLPAGFLLVATVGGQLATLPVGLPHSAVRSTGCGNSVQSAAPRTDGSITGQLEGLCAIVGPTGMPLMLLQQGKRPAACAAVPEVGESARAELVLLAQSGRLVRAAELTGWGSMRSVVLAGGSSAGVGAATGMPPLAHTENSGPLCSRGTISALVRLVGAHSAAVAGRHLFFLPQLAAPSMECGATAATTLPPLASSSHFGVLDGSSPQNLRCVSLTAVHGDAPAAQPASVKAVLQPAGTGRALGVDACLLAAAQVQRGRTLLVMLTSRGTLLVSDAAAGVVEASNPCLEGSMQRLLGTIAELSSQQEALQRQLAALDSRLAQLSAAICTARQLAALRRTLGTPTAVPAQLYPGGCALRRGGLCCTLRPLHGLTTRLEARCGSWQDPEALRLEVCITNRSQVALAGRWSVLVALCTAYNGDCSPSRYAAARTNCSCFCPGGLTSGVVLAAPLGLLQAGGQWLRELQLAPGSAARCAATNCKLRVLLCCHGDPEDQYFAQEYTERSWQCDKEAGPLIIYKLLGPAGYVDVVIDGSNNDAEHYKSIPASAACCCVPNCCIAGSLLLVHSVQLDSLHLLQLDSSPGVLGSRSSSNGGSARMQPSMLSMEALCQLAHTHAAAIPSSVGATDSAKAAQLRLLLQLRNTGSTPRPISAELLLQQLAEMGLSCEPQPSHTLKQGLVRQNQQQGQPAALLPRSFNLLLPAGQPGKSAALAPPGGLPLTQVQQAGGSLPSDLHLSLRTLHAASNSAFSSASPSQSYPAQHLQLVEVTAQSLAGDAMRLLECHLALMRRFLALAASQGCVKPSVVKELRGIALVQIRQQHDAGRQLPAALNTGPQHCPPILPSGAPAQGAPEPCTVCACRASCGSALPAVRTSVLEQALQQLRQLKEATMKLRDSAADLLPPDAGCRMTELQPRAADQQTTRQLRQTQLLQLVLGARRALSGVPIQPSLAAEHHA